MNERRVAIAVLTYRRPGELARVLPLLVDQAGAVRPAAEVIVVDNDPAGSARAEAESAAESAAARSGTAISVRYVHEPTPGIAAARNRAISEARCPGEDGGRAADAVVFIDDDETPCENWLPLLVARWREDRCAAVAGPVRRVLDSEPDPWVVGANVFKRRVAMTGEAVDWAGTGNLLVDLAQAHRLGVSFDERFGLTGGGDELYTRQIVARGGTIIWCDEAEALEPVVVARATRAWVRQRAFRQGNGSSRVSLELAPSRRARLTCRVVAHGRSARMMARGVRHWLRGIVSRSQPDIGFGVCRMAFALGLLTGAYGYVYGEYRRAEASSLGQGKRKRRPW